MLLEIGQQHNGIKRNIRTSFGPKWRKQITDTSSHPIYVLRLFKDADAEKHTFIWLHLQ